MYENGETKFAPSNSIEGKKLYVRNFDEQNKAYYVKVDAKHKKVSVASPPQNICQKDVNKINRIFWLNIIFTILGYAAYWFCWPISIITVKIFKKKKKKKN